jgi:hypothetical protein
MSFYRSSLWISEIPDSALHIRAPVPVYLSLMDQYKRSAAVLAKGEGDLSSRSPSMSVFPIVTSRKPYAHVAARTHRLDKCTECSA